MRKPLIVVSSRIAEQAAGAQRPRLDYLEIAKALDGSLLGYNLSDRGWYARVRQLERRLKLDIVEATTALRRSSDHNAVVTLSEKSAIPLVALARLTGNNTPQIVVAHKLSSGLKTHLFRLFGLQHAFAHIICVCRAQVDFAVQQLGVPSSNVHFVHDKVDHRFFSPVDNAAGDYILSVGQEQRDYETLRQGVAGTGLKLVVVASSPWSTSRVQVSDAGNIEVLSGIPFTRLRDLYAGARLVVVPLYNVDYAAGVNSLLEAMAMAKPVIVSRTRGISDYVVDGETAQYTPPGDVTALRDGILSLWHDAAALQRLGDNARRAVEEQMNLDIYVSRIAEIVRAVT